MPLAIKNTTACINMCQNLFAANLQTDGMVACYLCRESCDSSPLPCLVLLGVAWQLVPWLGALAADFTCWLLNCSTAQLLLIILILDGSRCEGENRECVMGDG